MQGLNKQLDYGQTDPQVKLLQQFLNQSGFPVAVSGAGSAGNETTYFGPATQAALQKYQVANGIVSSGNPTSTGYGRLGPQTLAKIQGDSSSSMPSTQNSIPQANQLLNTGNSLASSGQASQLINPGTQNIFSTGIGPQSPQQSQNVQSGNASGYVMTSRNHFDVYVDGRVVGSADNGDAAANLAKSLAPNYVGAFGDPARAASYTAELAKNSSTGQSNTSSLQDPASSPQTTITGNPTLDGLLSTLQGYITNNLAIGNTVNPNLQITPELTSQFLSEAHQVIDPYYKQQLQTVIGDVNRNLSSLSQRYGLAQADSQANFQQNLANTREANAGAGTAFSGGRGLQEQNALGAQNRSLQSLGLTASDQARQLLEQGAGQVGADTLGLGGSTSNFNIPSFNSQTSTLEGPRGGVGNSGTLDLGYNPSNFQMGSIPSSYANSLTSQANQFLSNYQKSASNNSLKQFTNNNGTVSLT